MWLHEDGLSNVTKLLGACEHCCAALFSSCCWGTLQPASPPIFRKLPIGNECQLLISHILPNLGDTCKFPSRILSLSSVQVKVGERWGALEFSIHLKAPCQGLRC